ncbi:BTAD domain-containing putative transcriptional regulator [Nocardioides nitrophenolicus]|uniref:BTAD domain-containing putative transcriptional regulator n=1 Tax=Nocardioides nitrophenolicus TaxID=60489 RepID=UPI00195BD65A|nr:BTAD domain-containing putative transcriptional regulator [Nocardioides nitrophenolicus]MBM7517739.1 putative ATPase/DNA-binding SARP family transcriptional activator [Nocardioides nitrophenolicus]
MEYGVLGELTAAAAGVDHTPRGQRSRDLLAVLLLRPGRAVGPEVLLDLVWGEEATRLDVSVVHTQVARLRRALGADQVVTTPTGYRLTGCRTDADRFLDLVGEARRADRPARAVDLLDAARRLWRGPRPFADVADTIAGAEVARLVDARLAADELLVELLLTASERDAAVRALSVARELVEREPLRERSSELAMLAAARLDEQAEAIATYERMRQVLRDELGVDPGRTLQQLHARVLDQDVTLLLPRPSGSEALTERRGGVRVSAPPVPVSRLVGRSAELGTLLDLVARRRVVAVTGPAGVGKTRLALEVADQLAGQREICFVDLAAAEPDSPAEVTEAVAAALGLAAEDAEPDRVADALVDRSLLLVVDEAERHRAGVAELAAAVARRCPRVTVLVTSRAALGVIGEVDLPLAPLEVPGPSATGPDLAAVPAVQLLLERLHDHSPTMAVGEAQLARLASYARQLDGLPLALELVAGYAGSRSLADLGELLEAPLDLAAADVGRSLRHRSLRDAVRWTVERLRPEQRIVLGRLAVFVGGFDQAAARHVVGDDLGSTTTVDGLVHGLVRESLLQVERTAGGLRLRLLRTVRDCALEDVAGAGDLRAARARHRAWFAAPRGGSEDGVIEHVRLHYDDHLAALRSAVDVGDGAAAVALLLRLGRWWEAREMAAAGRRWTGRLLTEVSLDPYDVARVRALRGNLLVDHDPDGARADFAAAIPLLEVDEDGENLVLALIGSAIERSMSGATVEAVVDAEAAVSAARRLQPSRLRLALSVLAAIAVELDPGRAEAVAAEALELLLAGEVTDDVPGVAANVAWTLFSFGRAGDALEILLRVAGELDASAVPSYLRIHIGWAHLLLGQGTAALHAFGGALAGEGPDLGARWHADALVGAGCALAELADPAAEELLSGAEELSARTGYMLSGWQSEAVARARTSLAGRPVPWAAGRAVAGRRLSQLLADSLVRH